MRPLVLGIIRVELNPLVGPGGNQAQREQIGAAKGGGGFPRSIGFVDSVKSDVIQRTDGGLLPPDGSLYGSMTDGVNGTRFFGWFVCVGFIHGNGTGETTEGSCY